MNPRSLDIDILRASVNVRNIEWQQHALNRLFERAIERADVLHVLLTGERIEDYPDDYPWPSALFYGWSDGRPLHVVAALSEETNAVAIITAYEPTEEHFEPDLRTRKKR